VLFFLQVQINYKTVMQEQMFKNAIQIQIMVLTLVTESKSSFFKNINSIEKMPFT
jgi:hypothetical protein